MLFRTTSIIAILASVGMNQANSADLLSRKGPELYAPAPLFTWTGFYLGGSLGYIDHNHMTIVTQGANFAPNDKLPLNGNGALLSVNAGFNYQFGSVVLGAEADIGYSTTSASNTFFAPNPWMMTHSSNLRSMGTVRARLGYAFDRMLIYATGGLAYASIKESVFSDQGWGGHRLTVGGIRTGWTLGGGMEYAVTDNWSLKAEALYASFAKKSGVTTNPFCTGCRYGFKNSVVTARAGVNYKF